MIKFNDYKKCLLNGEIILKSQQRFISNKHDVYTEDVNKIALSNDDDNQIILVAIHTDISFKELGYAKKVKSMIFKGIGGNN